MKLENLYKCVDVYVCVCVCVSRSAKFESRERDLDGAPLPQRREIVCDVRSEESYEFFSFLVRFFASNKSR